MANPYRELTDEALENVRERNAEKAQGWLTFGSPGMAKKPTRVARAARREQERRKRTAAPRMSANHIGTWYIIGSLALLTFLLVAWAVN